MDIVDISYSFALNLLINHYVLLDFALVLSEIFHLKKCLPWVSCFLLYVNGLNDGTMDMVKVSYSCDLNPLINYCILLNCALVSTEIFCLKKWLHVY